EEIVPFRHHDRVVRAATAWLDYLGAALAERGLGTPNQNQGRREKNDAGCQDAIPGCLQHRSTPNRGGFQYQWNRTPGPRVLEEPSGTVKGNCHRTISSRIQSTTARAAPGHCARERWRFESCHRMADPVPGPGISRWRLPERKS